MSKSSIVGYWTFASNRIRLEDGSWHEEHLFGGGMAFSPAGDSVLYVRSEQGSWGFAGKYTFNGSTFKVLIDASTSPDIEGKTLEREVKFVNDDELLYSGSESHTGRDFETRFIRAKSAS